MQDFFFEVLHPGGEFDAGAGAVGEVGVDLAAQAVEGGRFGVLCLRIGDDLRQVRGWPSLSQAGCEAQETPDRLCSEIEVHSELEFQQSFLCLRHPASQKLGSFTGADRMFDLE